MVTVGIVDTTFARFNMGKLAVDTIRELNHNIKIIRNTVPGIKDLPVASKLLLDQGCNVVMAIGMPGSMPIDKQCADQASNGLIKCQLMTNKHIIECFIFEDEAETDSELLDICIDRTVKHAENLVHLSLNDKEWFIERAGKG